MLDQMNLQRGGHGIGYQFQDITSAIAPRYQKNLSLSNIFNGNIVLSTEL